MTCALEDAGWVIRDMLLWVHLQGFPKSRASLKPAYEPIVMARKPGASRDLNIDACRIGTGEVVSGGGGYAAHRREQSEGWNRPYVAGAVETEPHAAGRWPSNILMTEDVFGGGVDGIAGGGETMGKGVWTEATSMYGTAMERAPGVQRTGDSGSKSRVFIIPKAPTSERIVDGKRSPHPT